MRALGFGLLLLLCTRTVLADDAAIAALIGAGHLTVESAISPDRNLVPGQKLGLTIEIATDSWFSGGTRIRIPEVPGLVILQTGQFAANSTERRAGATWVVQRWTLDIYPQQAGDYTVGPLELQVKVGGSGGNVEGSTTSPPVSFSVTIPEVLQDAPFWVAAPQFSASESFDRDLEGLVPGDAIERTITFEATDTMAMMLPPFEAADLPGLASYPAPPVLDNYNNRGEVRARRVQAISYVVEAPGTYLFPARDYFWWDTDNAKLKLVTLPATEIRVAGEVAVGAAPGKQKLSWQLAAGTVGAALLLAILAWALLHYRPWQWLAVLSGPAHRLWALLHNLRRPALPERLNPGSSAGE